MEALVAAAMLQEVIRDLHIKTRMAGWLFFNAVPRAGALIDMDEAVEDCKTYANVTSCPFFVSERTKCPCEWQDIRQQIKRHQCTSYDGINTRPWQRRYWHVQRTDADPETGNRSYAKSFPQFDSRPNNTLWWNTTDELPGSYKGRNASGYRTAYDRIRVASAMAVVDIPIYNYATPLPRKSHVLGTSMGFEADGGLTGYDGCAHDHPYMSWWHSSDENQAFQIAPELCPKGKYGYDCRCRGWYAKGKAEYRSTRRPVFITSPYRLPSNAVAGSATSPIANPNTGEYVGQVLLDFAPFAISEVLYRLGGPKSFLVIPGNNSTYGDTVFGPDRTNSGWEPTNIVDILFANESRTSNREYFESNILPDMKSGGCNITSYKRSIDGKEDEEVFIAYHPVHATSFLAVAPDDFGRGVTLSKNLIYMVGAVSPKNVMINPFQEVKKEISKDHERLRTAYALIVAIVTVCFTLYTCLVGIWSPSLEPSSSLLPFCFGLSHLLCTLSGNIIDYETHHHLAPSGSHHKHRGNSR